MCGIAGLIDTCGELAADSLRDRATAMTAVLRHRGPDDSGVWIDRSRGLALGHRRLAVVDLSTGGHQPMVSRSGRYVITFNGEIYNYRELRHEMEGSYGFVSQTDTEVILAAVERWGVPRTLDRLVGMFAFALWDAANAVLFLVRDRVGEKPLYYGQLHGVFAFASELKSFALLGSERPAIDRSALTALMRYACIPAPLSIYSGICKVPAGFYVTARFDGNCLTVEHHRYWLAPLSIASRPAGYQRDDEQACDQLQALLREVLRGQVGADVPVGAFLSGGVDSSTIVALLQTQASRSVKTFTIGFNEPQYNEAHYAKAVAQHLGTDHTEVYVTARQAQDVIPELPSIYDEPFADSSQIPTFLLAKIARRQVTVVLSGDGGDEVFGGYTRYRIGAHLHALLRRLPLSLRTLAARTLMAWSPSRWDYVFGRCSALLPSALRQSLPGEKIHKLASVLNAQSPQLMYRTLASIWQNPSDVVIGAGEQVRGLEHLNTWSDTKTFIAQMMYWDFLIYLPDDILVKVDRASMAVSLESRAPYLDVRLIEYAATLPTDAKIRGTHSKYLLRKLLYRYVPPSLIERPKMGFGLPIDEWLRGPLRGWATDLLEERRLRLQGFFNPSIIQRCWREHLSGRRNWHHQLWVVLMFQAWLDAQRADDTRPLECALSGATGG